MLYNTLKREAIEENLEDLLEDFGVSSSTGGKRPATNGHLEEVTKS